MRPLPADMQSPESKISRNSLRIPLACFISSFTWLVMAHIFLNFRSMMRKEVRRGLRSSFHQLVPQFGEPFALSFPLYPFCLFDELPSFI